MDIDDTKHLWRCSQHFLGELLIADERGDELEGPYTWHEPDLRYGAPLSLSLTGALASAQKG